MQPTLHHPVPMNSRVRIPETYLGRKATGTVVGIGMVHVIFTYIVLLDEPYQDPQFGETRAVIVPGPDLCSEDGLTDWKLKQ